MILRLRSIEDTTVPVQVPHPMAVRAAAAESTAVLHLALPNSITRRSSSLDALFLVVSWGLFASLQQAEEMGEKNAKKIIDEFKPKKNNNNKNSSAVK